MKKWNAIRVIGLVGAVLLVAFGGIGNLMRTVKFGVLRLNKK